MELERYTELDLHVGAKQPTSICKGAVHLYQINQERIGKGGFCLEDILGPFSNSK